MKKQIHELMKLNMEVVQCGAIHETHNSLKTYFAYFSPHAIKTCHWQDMLKCSLVKIMFHFC